jgi:hypothetical protein
MALREPIRPVQRRGRKPLPAPERTAPAALLQPLQTEAKPRPTLEQFAPMPVLQALQQPEKQRTAKLDSRPTTVQEAPPLRVNDVRNQGQPKQAANSVAKIPAPVLGWYTASSIAESPPGTALVIENFFCEANALRMRRGSQEHATGLNAALPVETLALYTSGTQEEMYGACGTKIFDVTSPGAVGAAVVTGLSHSRWQYTNFATTGGQFLMMVNGADDMLTYDGSAWDTSSGITGVNGADLTNIWPYRERIWFTEDQSTDLWYLATDAITGPANALACGSLLSRGGSMIAGISWSVSDDSGKEDFLVAISSEGEMLVFAGTDPSDPTAWGFFGGYFVGKPLGPRCLFKVGGDILIISQEGLLPLSQAITLDRAVFSKAAMTKNISPTYADAVRRYGGNLGWEMVTLPVSNMAILNVPTAEGQSAQQIVWNTATGGLSQFTGWNACCWALFEDEIYFGGTMGTVYHAETGAQDVEEDIIAYLLPAYDDLGAPAVLKHVKLVKPIFESNLVIAPEISVAVDYEDPQSFNASPIEDTDWFTWDSSLWDEHPWLGTNTFRAWQSGMNIGAAISPATRVTITDGGEANDLTYRLFAYHILYEKGGVVG